MAGVWIWLISSVGSWWSSIGLSSLHGWRLDPADQLRPFLVELNQLELASQLVFVIKLTGPRLHKSRSRSELMKRLSTLTESELCSILTTEVGGFVAARLRGGLSPSPLWVISSSS
ncbi:hypothetical protein FCV25MIE_12121 [Fagus crenata]